jgi:hypothetical protein
VPEHYETIQAAMDAAAAGDTVTVAPGTYTDVHEFEFFPGFTGEAVVIMKPGVTLLGRPDTPELVIIEGTSTTIGIYCQDADSTTVITGVTVTGASSGIMGRFASPTITHCRLVANLPESPFSSGAGLYGDYFSPTISDCLFEGNIATSGGGATFANESFPVLRRCEFRGNMAWETVHNPGHGAALSVAHESRALLIDCSITGNLAAADGGAVNVYDAVVRLENTAVTGNEAGNRGGALFVRQRARVELFQVDLTGNIAGEHGGGVHVMWESAVDAVDSHVRDNEAPSGADGYLESAFDTQSVTLTCCDVDPAGWVGEELVIDDSDCD